MTEIPSNKKPIPAILIVAALVMLIGIILIGYGHFQNKNIVFYVGLIMTLAGVLIGIFRIVIHGER
jgi:Na+-transporting NADH:ubiquinone oxidoreductase subunit NqrD